MANGAAAARSSKKFRRSTARSLARVREASAATITNKSFRRAQEAFQKWRMTPGAGARRNRAPARQCLARSESDLGKLVTMEMGKIIAEGEGEVQEMIDICDFAVGQSRMLYGLTIQSERPSHRLMEQWHPLGIVGGDLRV